MMNEDAFVKLSDHLSAGLLANNIMMTVFRFKTGIRLRDEELLLLNDVKNVFEYLAAYSDEDALTIAIEAPLRYAADNHSLSESLRTRIKVNDVKRASAISDALGRIINKEEGADVGIVEEYFSPMARARFEYPGPPF